MHLQKWLTFVRDNNTDNFRSHVKETCWHVVLRYFALTNLNLHTQNCEINSSRTTKDQASSLCNFLEKKDKIWRYCVCRPWEKFDHHNFQFILTKMCFCWFWEDMPFLGQLSRPILALHLFWPRYAMHHSLKTMRYAPCFLQFISTGGVGYTCFSPPSSLCFVCWTAHYFTRECESGGKDANGISPIWSHNDVIGNK